MLFMLLLRCQINKLFGPTRDAEPLIPMVDPTSLSRSHTPV